MPSLVPVIQANVGDIRIALRDLVQHYPHILQTGQIARRRRVRARSGFRRGIHRIDIEVLSSIVVLGKKDVLAVPRPQVSGDRPLGLSSKKPRRAEWLTDSLYINIAGVFPRLEKGDVVAVRR